MKAILFDQDLNKKLKLPLSDIDVEIDFRGESHSENEEEIGFFDQIKFKIDNLLGRNGVGGEIPADFIPILTEGLNLIVESSRILFLSVIGNKLYDVYKETNENKKIKENSKEEYNRVLQIITDDRIWSGSLDSKMSISFIFQDGLTIEQFTQGLKQIPEVRTKIYNLLDTADLVNNRVECTYNNEKWNVTFL